uniref:Uncharacterized protein n=1 Tax=Rhizophora mucronata TaxID=61149 RepID=A0A2P2PWI2_RHIMU
MLTLCCLTTMSKRLCQTATFYTNCGMMASKETFPFFFCYVSFQFLN